MPYSEVMHKFKAGELHSGSKRGPEVTNRQQAIAIMLSEKRAANAGKAEYKSKSLGSMLREDVPRAKRRKAAKKYGLPEE